MAKKYSIILHIKTIIGITQNWKVYIYTKSNGRYPPWNFVCKFKVSNF